MYKHSSEQHTTESTTVKGEAATTSPNPEKSPDRRLTPEARKETPGAYTPLKRQNSDAVKGFIQDFPVGMGKMHMGLHPSWRMWGMLRPKAPPGGGGGGGGGERGGGGYTPSQGPYRRMWDMLRPKAPTGGCGVCSVPRPPLGGVGYAPSQGPSTYEASTQRVYMHAEPQS